MLSFDDIINTESNKTAIVCGLGPSLNKQLPRYRELCKDKNKYIFVSCNRWDLLMGYMLMDYWVIANPRDTIEKMYEIMNRKQCTIFYADSVDLTDRQFIESNLEKKWLGYDQRHTRGHPCDVCDIYGCKKYRSAARLTLQEQLREYLKTDKIYTAGATVSLHMLSFAILLGCKEIYISGVDLDYETHGQYIINDGRYRPNTPNGDMHKFRAPILKDFKTIKDSISTNINIYTTNKGGHLNSVFEYKEI